MRGANLGWGRKFASGVKQTRGVAVDADTYAMWRCDEESLQQWFVLVDSVGVATMTSTGSLTTTPRVTAGPAVGAFARMVGDTRNGLIDNSNPGAFASVFQGDCTVEAYVLWNQAAEGWVYCYTAPGETQATNTQFACAVTAAGRLKTNWEYGPGNDCNLTQAAGAVVTVGAWHHLAWVKSGGSVLFYINGVLQDTVAIPVGQAPNGGTSAYHYGFGHYGGTGQWQGCIRALKISDTALSAATLLAHYNEMTTTATNGGVTSSTRALWLGDDQADCVDDAGRLPLNINSDASLVVSAAPLAGARGRARGQYNSGGACKIEQPGSTSTPEPWVAPLMALLRGDFSLDAWLYPAVTTTSYGLFYVDGTGAAPGGNYFSARIVAASGVYNLRFVYQTGAVPTLVTYNTPALFTIADLAEAGGIHLGFTKEVIGGGAQCVFRTYYNGGLVDTSPAQTNYDGTEKVDTRLWLGDIATVGWNGRYDEVRLSSKVRSAAEMLAAYNAGAGGGVVAYRPNP